MYNDEINALFDGPIFQDMACSGGRVEYTVQPV